MCFTILQLVAFSVFLTLTHLDLGQNSCNVYKSVLPCAAQKTNYCLVGAGVALNAGLHVRLPQSLVPGCLLNGSHRCAAWSWLEKEQPNIGLFPLSPSPCHCVYLGPSLPELPSQVAAFMCSFLWIGAVNSSSEVGYTCFWLQFLPSGSGVL